ncbi:mating-type protein A1 [Monosporozyma servazzii]
MQQLLNVSSKLILESDLCLCERKNLLLQIYDNSSGRTHLTKDTRLFLEKVFIQKQWLTKDERQLIATKCGLSPLQVRIWFIKCRHKLI